MTTISGETIAEVFAASVAAVRQGAAVSPRAMPTREVLDVRLLIDQPRGRLLPAQPARVLNPAFAVAECVWILSGTDASWIYDYNDRLRQYAEDDGILRGAYGPRMRRWDAQVDQLAQVVATLSDDPDSRRAVIQLYDPARDAGGHRDVPCTLGYRFHLRGGRLHMVTTMRSNDLWTGLPYDIFTATVMHELMAGWLGVDLGPYHHHVDSLHLYEHDFEAAGAVQAGTPCEVMPSLVTPWSGFDELLTEVLMDRPVGQPGWDAMAAVMASYRLWKSGERAAACERANGISGPLGEGLRGWYTVLQQRASAAAR
ncbi:thymidylate synthase [Sinosporangium album]|uniref:thymidylate synthase n=1 Tax=Sinosporangium album TaxID=504805 RepID=A0A1G7XJ10_9ACTN|nr:thymidylate synthase [Sinosporangium album]SDG84137.1 thymidylate synthase [Sinosporangium album]